MSRRAGSPDPRRKRRLSLDNEGTDKRSRQDDVRTPTGIRTEGASSASGGHARMSRSASSSRHGDRVDQRSNGSPNSSAARSSPNSEEEPAVSISQPRPTSVPRRPTWQTALSSESGDWSGNNGRDTRDSREQRESRDPRDVRHARDARHERAVSRGGGGGSPPSFTTNSANTHTQPAKAQAAFVGKLFSMLEDEKITKSGLLFWSQDGTSFVCPNPTEFSKEVLPNFFKHNNWQSFVRQLNMYSFNKVSDLYSTANSDPQAWEFRHPLFRRGEPHLLASIKRKSTRQPQTDIQNTSPQPPADDEARPVAGWLRDPRDAVGGGASLQPPSGPSYRRSPSRDYTTRPYYQSATVRPVSSGYGSRAVSHSLSPPRHHMPPHIGSRSHSAHQVPTYAPAESSRSAEPVAYYAAAPSGHASPVEALSGQVATLQDTVHRLWQALHQERVDNARVTYDHINYMYRMSDWMSEVGRDLRLAPENVNVMARLRHDLLQRLDSLNASETLTSLGHDDRRGPAPYEAGPPPRSMQAALHDARQVHTSHQRSTPPPPHVDRMRPMTEAGPSGSFGSPRLYSASTPRPPPAPDFRFRPPLEGQEVTSRDLPRDVRVHHHASRLDRDAYLADDVKPAIDMDAPKTSLRNLLH